MESGQQFLFLKYHMQEIKTWKEYLFQK